MAVAAQERPETASSFSAEVRARTAERHSRAEHSAFMQELMEGRLDAAAYGLLLAQYRPVYAALEEVGRAFRDAGEPLTAPFNQPGLDRLDAIDADLEHFAQDPAELPVLRSTADYAEHLRSLADSPERFLAHHYLRYLGDLSGGQAIAALMARHYGIPAEALSMYRFPDLPKPKVFKDQYRALLDEAPFTDEQRQNFLEEAVAGFDRNAAVFAELDAARRG